MQLKLYTVFLALCHSCLVLAGNVVSVSNGEDQTVCSLLTNGCIECVGSDAYDLVSSKPSVCNFKAVSVSRAAACALSHDNDLVCWGTGFITHPVVAHAPKAKFKSLSVSGMSAAGLTPTGELKAWGSLAQRVGKIEKCESISLGNYGGCALCERKLHCFGDGFFGYEIVSKMPHHEDFIEVSVGDIGCAIHDGGACECWGNPFEPLIEAEFNFEQPVKSISVGKAIVCGIFFDGCGFCHFLDHDNNPGTKILPGDFKQVSAGKNGACFVTQSGDVYGWNVDC